MKIALTNNYDLSAILSAWHAENGKAPSQHLWGYVELTDQGHDVTLVTEKRHALLSALSRKLKAVGDLELQYRLAKSQGSYEAIYSGHHLTTGLLALLRRLGLVRIPLVAVAYQVPRSDSALARLFVKLFVMGADKLLCLSDQLIEDYQRLGVPRDRLKRAHWGVDMRHYHTLPARTDAVPASSETPYILSPGKSFRDYRTLFRGLDQVPGCRLIVTGATDLKIPDAFSDPQRVHIEREFISWQALLKLYAGALAVVIPIDVGAGTFNNAIGLTNATEALACGRPIIATENPYLGIDIEGERVGIVVKPGDTNGWANAIRRLVENPDEADEMGARARRLAESKFNITRYAQETIAALEEAVAQK